MVVVVVVVVWTLRGRGKVLKYKTFIH